MISCELLLLCSAFHDGFLRSARAKLRSQNADEGCYYRSSPTLSSDTPTPFPVHSVSLTAAALLRLPTYRYNHQGNANACARPQKAKRT